MQSTFHSDELLIDLASHDSPWEHLGESLDGRHDLSAVHLVVAKSVDAILIGEDIITIDNLLAYVADFNALTDCLSVDGTLHFHGPVQHPSEAIGHGLSDELEALLGVSVQIVVPLVPSPPCQPKETTSSVPAIADEVSGSDAPGVVAPSIGQPGVVAPGVGKPAVIEPVVVERLPLPSPGSASATSPTTTPSTLAAPIRLQTEEATEIFSLADSSASSRPVPAKRGDVLMHTVRFFGQTETASDGISTATVRLYLPANELFLGVDAIDFWRPVLRNHGRPDVDAKRLSIIAGDSIDVVSLAAALQIDIAVHHTSNGSRLTLRLTDDGQDSLVGLGQLDDLRLVFFTRVSAGTVLTTPPMTSGAGQAKICQSKTGPSKTGKANPMLSDSVNRDLGQPIPSPPTPLPTAISMRPSIRTPHPSQAPDRRRIDRSHPIESPTSPLQRSVVPAVSGTPTNLYMPTFGDSPALT